MAATIVIGLYVRADLLVVAAMIPLLPMLALNTGATGRTSASGSPHFFGVISYSIYLIQLPINLEADRLSAGIASGTYLHWLLPPIVIILVASATYRLIEKPCNDGIRWLGNSLSRLGNARVTPERTEAQI